MSEWIVASSILILLIIGIRACFRNKIALRARYALWLVVALRLLVPLSFSESSLSVLNFLRLMPDPEGQAGIPAQTHEMPNRGSAAAGEILPGTFSAAEGEAGRTDGGFCDIRPVNTENAGNTVQNFGFAGTSGENSGHEGSQAAAADMGNGIGEPDGARSVKQDTSFSDTVPEKHKVSNIFFGFWLAGAAVIAFVVLSVNSGYRRKIYGSRARCRMGGRSALPVYITPAVVTPCMFGLLHPAVYLTPGIEGNGKALKYVLCHENTHYRHRDNLWALVRVVCVCLHWYNPLVWIAAELSRQDCELACDEKALQLLDEEDRIDYGRTLLDFSVQSDALPGGLQLSTAVAGGKKQLKERLMMIVSHPHRPAGALALALALVLLVSASTFTGKVNGQELAKEPSEEGRMAGSFGGDGEDSSAAEGSGRAGNGQKSVINTSIVTIDLNDGKDYTLKTVWENKEGGEEYRITQLEMNWIHDKMEEKQQVISLEDVKVLYTISIDDIRKNGGQMWAYFPEREALYAKPLCIAEDLPDYAAGSFAAEESGTSLSELCDGGILAVDLNFDGYQDFCLRGRGDGENVPYYCYLWNLEEGKFEPGYMVPNIRVDENRRLIESATVDGNDVYTVKYYRFDENNTLHMLRYVEDNRSQDAVFPALDLTYCETSYGLPAVDEWDYGTRYGGALTERFVSMAKEALTELYEWSGTKIETACFTVTDFGGVSFGNTPQDMDASRDYYHRCYGEQAGFKACISHMNLSTERVVWYSPVIQWNIPESLAQMTDEEVVLWYFARSAVAGDERAETIEESYENCYVIKAESGNYYEIDINPSTREVSSIFGPYDSFPVH